MIFFLEEIQTVKTWFCCTKYVIPCYISEARSMLGGMIDIIGKGKCYFFSYQRSGDELPTNQ